MYMLRSNKMRFALGVSILCCLVSASSSKRSAMPSERRREGKIFSLFQLIRFPNDPCNSTDLQLGMCYTAEECSSRNGINSGSCAQSFGVCCQFPLTCGGQSSENASYFGSIDATAPGFCSAKICPPPTRNICQLRLNFLTFSIGGPSTSTTTVGLEIGGSPVQEPKLTAGGAFSAVPFTTATRCDDDEFSVTSPGSPTPPGICGLNTNEHMFVDASPGSCNSLVFKLGSAPTNVNVARREWNMQILQFSCDSDNLAPDGCTKYFFSRDSSLGTVKTYNFDMGAHLANQWEKFCIRRERNTCRICWSTALGADFDLTASATGMGIIGTMSQCCGYGLNGLGNKEFENGLGVKGFDCLVIPGAEKRTADRQQLRFDEFCGGGNDVLDGGLFTVISGAATTICSSRQPFMISFTSDGTELSGEGTLAAPNLPNRGFKLQYSLEPC